MQHIVTCHGNTLLPQFLGMYRVTVEGEDTYLLVTRNVFSHQLHVHRKYDLKVSLCDSRRSGCWGEEAADVPFFSSFRANERKQRFVTQSALVLLCSCLPSGLPGVS